MEPTPGYSAYWEDVKNLLVEESDGRVDEITTKSVETYTKLEKCLKAIADQTRKMFTTIQDDGAFTHCNARGGELSKPLPCLEHAETRDSLLQSLVEMEELAKYVQIKYDSFNAADSKRKKRKPEEIKEEQSKKPKTDTSVA
jgi:hypothetical protein